MTTTKHRLLPFGLFIALTLPGQAQTYTSGAGAKLSTASVNTGDGPQLTFWDGSGPTISRQAYGTADSGVLNCFARSEHYDSATFQSDALSFAICEADDLVFSSAASGSVQIGLHMTLEGQYFFQQGTKLSVSTQLNSSPLGSAQIDGSGLSGTGVLSSYAMQGQTSFTKYFSVPLNTPVSLRLRMDVYSGTSSQGFKNNGSYSLRLGGSTPLSPVYAVCDLPAGVRLDSPSLGIVDNHWSAPTDVHLSADSLDPAPGEVVRLRAWNGATGLPVGMLYAYGVPTPPLAFSTRQYSGLIGSFDSKGWWSAAPITHQPWMAGLELRARAVTQGPGGGLVLSEPVTIQFQ